MCNSLQETKVSEHVITELELQCKYIKDPYVYIYMYMRGWGLPSLLELQCKLGRVHSSLILRVDLLYRCTHIPQFNAVESILIEICQWWVGYQTVIWSLIRSFLPPVFVPSMADTDPQIFCKRFQLYLGDMDYVSHIAPQLNHMCWCDQLLNVTCTAQKCTLHGLWTFLYFLFVLFLTKDLADALKSPHHWLTLHITGQGRLSYTCHVIRCPLSPCVLLAGVRKQHLSWILDVHNTCICNVHVILEPWTFVVHSS